MPPPPPLQVDPPGNGCMHLVCLPQQKHIIIVKCSVLLCMCPSSRSCCRARVNQQRAREANRAAQLISATIDPEPAVMAIVGVLLGSLNTGLHSGGTTIKLTNLTTAAHLNGVIGTIVATPTLDAASKIPSQCARLSESIKVA